ncbi:MAG: glycosyltransferase family 2 protein [Anaerolineales bacterium]|nr:glycosyltransferase family 2 protein [Anaerolineales bacterium]
MQSTRLATIVVNWNLEDETTRCLESLQGSQMPTSVILVDNGSQDGSADALAARFPPVELLRLPRNLGFGRACNLGIRRALADPGVEAIFLLNNDAAVHPAALGELLRAAQADPRAGILGPKVYARAAPAQVWYAGARRRRGVLAAADSGRGQVDRGQFEQPRRVDYVFGAAMWVQRPVFERIGLFDERFFLYLEDLDFCLRAQQAGFSPLFVPQALAWHTGSASTAGDAWLRRRHHLRSTALFLRKHLSPAWAAPALAFWAAVLLKVALGDLFHLVRFK